MTFTPITNLYYPHNRYWFVMIILGAVGTGIGSESPLVVLTRRFRPQRIYVVSTVQATDRVKDLLVQVEDLPVEVSVIVVDPENPSKIMERLLGEVTERPDIVDITSGTKVLAAVLFLYGLCMGSKITYVTGKRDAETGRVVTGTEEVIFLDVSGVAENVRCEGAGET